jgi:glycosyltransferase involved in cell wall biosynthesis
MNKDRSLPVLVGHPFAPIGRGEDVRAAFRAFSSVGYPVHVRDIFSGNEIDGDIHRELDSHLVRNLSDSLNIFFINGDEVSNVLARCGGQLSNGAYNIVYPAWELSNYPAEWGKELERFDEVWAQSQFVYESLKKSIAKPVFYLPLASQVKLTSFLPRRYFDIPESAYVFLFFFDFSSFVERKNPFAVLDAFEKVCAQRPHADTRLLIKISGTDRRPEHYEMFCKKLDDRLIHDKVIILDRCLSDNEIKNLVRCCDSFVSLHRSEGFGRGMAEAMCLGKPVIATGYSGNLDFMNETNSCLVRYKEVPVEGGQYPYGTGQFWASADIDHAVECMLALLDDRQFGRMLGHSAERHMRQFFSYRSIGLKYKDRVEQILRDNAYSLKQRVKQKSSADKVDGPIIVYNMAKVGSRSIVDTLNTLKLGVPVYHRHVLHDLENMEKHIKETNPDHAATLNEIGEGIKLRKMIDDDTEKKWKLISLVRDPIARNVSRFFQSIEYEEILPNARKLLESGSASIEDLLDIFLNKWERSSGLVWFDKQLEPVFNIDVYEKPFPWDKGYDDFHKGRFSLLVIRLEDLDKCGEQALQEFLGLPTVKLTKSNVGADKWYKSAYKDFISQLTLPDNYLDEMYNSKFARHFYSEKELKAFRAKWSRNKT